MEKDFEKNLAEIVAKSEKTIFAVSFSTPQLQKVGNVLAKLKRKFGNKIIYLAGGPHPTGDPERTLKLGFDAVVMEEGEETFSELAGRIKNNEDFRKIKL